MTEADWLVSDDLPAMLSHLGRKVSKRKLRLFACACCRQVWHLLRPTGRQAVATSEWYADGQASEKELLAAGNTAWLRRLTPAQDAAGSVCRPNVSPLLVAGLAEQARVWDGPVKGASDYHGPWTFSCDLLREVVGNPFRPVSADPTWLVRNGGVADQLALSVYDERRFEDLPVLADALEEAGCTDSDILAHLRGFGAHVRGCWVVDLLLGKE